MLTYQIEVTCDVEGETRTIGMFDVQVSSKNDIDDTIEEIKTTMYLTVVECVGEGADYYDTIRVGKD